MTREKRVAEREADLAKMFDRLTERVEQHRQDCQAPVQSSLQSSRKRLLASQRSRYDPIVPYKLI